MMDIALIIQLLVLSNISVWKYIWIQDIRRDIRKCRLHDFFFSLKFSYRITAIYYIKYYEKRIKKKQNGKW